MKVIVITGSTKGIGRGLAEVFLSLGYQVAVASRRQSAVDETLAQLSTKYGYENIFGCVCDVNKMSDVQALWTQPFKSSEKLISGLIMQARQICLRNSGSLIAKTLIA